MRQSIKQIANKCLFVAAAASIAPTAFAGGAATRVFEFPMPPLNTEFFFDSGFIPGAMEFAGGTIVEASVMVSIDVAEAPAGEERSNGAEYFYTEIVFPVDLDAETPGVQAFATAIDGAEEGWSGLGSFSLEREVPELIGSTFVVPLFFSATTFGGDGKDSTVVLAEPLNSNIKTLMLDDVWRITVELPGAPCGDADLAEPFGELDIADVVAFLNAFGDGAVEADLSAPFGMFDVADVVAFLQTFGAGCP
ncbi:MAG: hypothetical protein CMJ31_08365 [Phycisphaerae bacterium]|nr:hypothetical protein [Phycisphaerae bacterium]